MSVDGLRLVATGEPGDMPAYAGRVWSGPDGDVPCPHLTVPDLAGAATVRLVIVPAPRIGREVLVEFPSTAGPVRLPYGAGMERLRGIDPDQADAVGQYAHTLAAGGDVRITARIGRGAGDDNDITFDDSSR